MRGLFNVVSEERYVSGICGAGSGPLARCVSNLMHLSLSLSLFGLGTSR
jgi:hypothetical protein